MLYKVTVVKSPYEIPVNSWSCDYQSQAAAVRHLISWVKQSIAFDKRFPTILNVRITLVSTGICVYDYHFVWDFKKNCLKKFPHVYKTSPHYHCKT